MESLEPEDAARAGAKLAATVSSAAALGFVPVAVQFDLFSLLVQIGPVASSEELKDAYDKVSSSDARPPLSLRLCQDTMFVMTSLEFVDLVRDNIFRANSITRLLVSLPSAPHGALHFTTEPLFAAPFLIRKLRDTNFLYPFQENETPTQYGYQLLGEDELAKENLYGIMHQQGRLPSFNIFMEGKFGKFGTMPDRVKRFGYDLDAAVSGSENPVVMIDIGGGNGEMLLELKAAYPHLTKESLVLQEFNPDMDKTDELTIMDWDFKSISPQPIQGALNYSLTHIYHNLPDLEALTLMQKVAKAMAPHSRMLIHEFSKNSTYGKMHATMVVQFGGGLRNAQEWRQMAALAGLQVTFEAYPPAGEGLVEMRKLQ